MEHRVIKNFKKKGYIQWFLKRFELKVSAASEILMLLYKSPELLDKVHFVEDIRPYANAVLISSDDAKTVSYLLRLDDEYYEDIGDFIRALQTREFSDLYIWLSYDREFICSKCSGIIEKAPEVIQRAEDENKVKALEKQLLDKLQANDGRKNQLYQLIDEALFQRDENLFNKLAKELQQLNEALD